MGIETGQGLTDPLPGPIGPNFGSTDPSYYLIGLNYCPKGPPHGLSGPDRRLAGSRPPIG